MKAVTEWETSSITLCLDGTELFLLEKPQDHKHIIYGKVKEGQVLLTLQQAIELKNQLEVAIKTYKYLDKGVLEDVC